MKEIKKIVSMALITTLIGSHNTNVYAENYFRDIEGTWGKDYILKLVEDDLMTGNNGEIRPKDNLTRAEMAAIFNRLILIDSKENLSKYRDISSDKWYFDDMGKIVKSGLIVGDGNNLNPEKAISREEVFVVLARFLNLNEDSKSVNFKDADLISTWSKGYIGALCKEGYIEGYEDNTIRPREKITREEFAKLISSSYGEIISTGNYSNKNISGNLVINKGHVTLSNSRVNGDLIITEGNNDSSVKLDNVKVNGRVIIRSRVKLELNDTNLNHVYIVDGIKPKLTLCKKSEISRLISDLEPTISGEGEVKERKKSDSIIKVHGDVIGRKKTVDVLGELASKRDKNTSLINKNQTESKSDERALEIALSKIKNFNLSLPTEERVEAEISRLIDRKIKVEAKEVSRRGDKYTYEINLSLGGIKKNKRIVVGKRGSNLKVEDTERFIILALEKPSDKNIKIAFDSYETLKLSDKKEVDWELLRDFFDLYSREFDKKLDLAIRRNDYEELEKILSKYRELDRDLIRMIDQDLVDDAKKMIDSKTIELASEFELKIKRLLEKPSINELKVILSEYEDLKDDIKNRVDKDLIIDLRNQIDILKENKYEDEKLEALLIELRASIDRAIKTKGKEEIEKVLEIYEEIDNKYLNDSDLENIKNIGKIYEGIVSKEIEDLILEEYDNWIKEEEDYQNTLEIYYELEDIVSVIEEKLVEVDFENIIETEWEEVIESVIDSQIYKSISYTYNLDKNEDELEISISILDGNIEVTRKIEILITDQIGSQDKYEVFKELMDDIDLAYSEKELLEIEIPYNIKNDSNLYIQLLNAKENKRREIVNEVIDIVYEAMSEKTEEAVELAFIELDRLENSSIYRKLVTNLLELQKNMDFNRIIKVIREAEFEDEYIDLEIPNNLEENQRLKIENIMLKKSREFILDAKISLAEFMENMTEANKLRFQRAMNKLSDLNPEKEILLSEFEKLTGQKLEEEEAKLKLESILSKLEQELKKEVLEANSLEELRLEIDKLVSNQLLEISHDGFKLEIEEIGNYLRIVLRINYEGIEGLLDTEIEIRIKDLEIDEGVVSEYEDWKNHEKEYEDMIILYYELESIADELEKEISGKDYSKLRETKALELIETVIKEYGLDYDLNSQVIENKMNLKIRLKMESLEVEREILGISLANCDDLEKAKDFEKKVIEAIENENIAVMEELIILYKDLEVEIRELIDGQIYLKLEDKFLELSRIKLEAEIISNYTRDEYKDKSEYDRSLERSLGLIRESENLEELETNYKKAVEIMDSLEKISIQDEAQYKLETSRRELEKLDFNFKRFKDLEEVINKNKVFEDIEVLIDLENLYEIKITLELENKMEVFLVKNEIGNLTKDEMDLKNILDKAYEIEEPCNYLKKSIKASEYTIFQGHSNNLVKGRDNLIEAIEIDKEFNYIDQSEARKFNRLEVLDYGDRKELIIEFNRNMIGNLTKYSLEWELPIHLETSIFGVKFPSIKKVSEGNTKKVISKSIDYTEGDILNLILYTPMTSEEEGIRLNNIQNLENFKYIKVN